MSNVSQKPQKNNSMLESFFNVEVLLDFLQAYIKEEISKQNTSNAKPYNIEEDWIGTEELAKITGLSKKNIYQKSFHKSFPFPCYKSGKKLRFKRSEVLASLEKQTQSFEFEDVIRQRADNYLVNKK
jgi:predicted DNA-binding transcriptional regulator AlpA